MTTHYGNSHIAGIGISDPAVPTVGAIPPVHPPGHPAVKPASRDFVLQVAAHIRQLRSKSTGVYDAVGTAMRLFMGLPGVIAASHFHRNDEDQFLASTPLLCKQSFVERARKWEPHLVQAVRKTVQKRCTVIEPLPTDGFDVICSPIGDQDLPTAALCVFVDRSAVNTLTMTLLVELAAAEFGVYGASARGADRGPLDHFLRTAAAAQENGTGFRELASALESTLRVSQVLIGTKTVRGQCRLQAVSGVTAISRPSSLVTLSEEVLSEAALRNNMRICDMGNPQSLSASETQLAQLLRAGRLITGPLRDAGDHAVGGWIVVDDGTANATPRGIPLLEQCESLAPIAAGILSLINAARPSLIGRVWHGAKPLLCGNQRWATFGAALALSALLALPWPYRIRCDCELQPLTRRYVAAPYDGQLKEVLVKPGDLVSAGQILARMDRSELEWRLAAQNAEYERASKQHDASMAQRETSLAQVARLEMQRLHAQRELLKERVENLEIKSPIDGIVLAGDPKKLVGARLTIGQALFETGPLERMVVEILIPHDEVAHFAPGNRTAIRLDALPYRKLEGEIQRISPQSESRDGQNVFIAEVELENPNRLLRPGMIGRGRVTSGPHSVGWNLFHKPAARLVRVLRW
jgi:RND family efflux transporter MFP subunit